MAVARSAQVSKGALDGVHKNLVSQIPTSSAKNLKTCKTLDN